MGVDVVRLVSLFAGQTAPPESQSPLPPPWRDPPHLRRGSPTHTDNDTSDQAIYDGQRLHKRLTCCFDSQGPGTPKRSDPARLELIYSGSTTQNIPLHQQPSSSNTITPVCVASTVARVA
ncbi:uncharacterized protein LACBIDRAFT_331971 [Laccaria bicolor S238N-H82]|uniref:Predicted protein n=1 Tax=Laccaria bicolor (strain S238N-H82 / ATCC MYA-4686) TaxID=486041 RepID=B0DR73_LACBS|nr:uncharacterized protein LACBIDRAFT_331971 [Laccaria bicolor S238N-H82]EDR02951.1 predicted protein [Laccaria bicolor S238N-H82]|eukprot:XP_001886374.1 predicted protein [Laccaria bicolor S238N-H82]